ncbi:MAG: RidA family protein, partial [Nitrososphaeraceae archaeon]
EDAAILCTLNALALLKDHLGSLDKIKQIVKLSAYINCLESFTDHPKVINSASNLLEKLFGEKGKHSRIAIGVESLPLGSTIEIDFIISI